MTLFVRDDDEGGVEETEPRFPKVKKTTSSKIQAVAGRTNNRTYSYPEEMEVLLMLGEAARQYPKDESSVLPSQLQIHPRSYDQVEEFLVPYAGVQSYWLGGEWPIPVSAYDKLGKRQVKCIGQPITGAREARVFTAKRLQLA